jgi:hypothetical protein
VNTLCMSADAVHNHVRGLAGWPGSRLQCWICQPGAPVLARPVEIRLLRTRVVAPEEAVQLLRGRERKGAEGQVLLVHGRMLVPCALGSWVEVLEGRWVGQEQRSQLRLSGRELMSGLGRRTLQVQN